jgi:NuA3 HAT complex component NTO1
METATLPTTPSRSATARSNTSRPKSERAAPRPKKATSAGLSSEPPKKKLRYIPGGPGGGGRYVDEDGTEIPVGGTGPGGYNYIGPRGRIGRENLANGVQPVVYPRRDSRRERSTRTQTVLPRAQQPPMRFASAAQAAAAVQSDGYKPREERGYEEFHPDLDLNSPFFAFSADEVDGITPAPAPAPASADGSVDDTHGSHTVNGTEGSTTRSEGNTTPTTSANRSPLLTMGIPGTPGGGKRRPGRPPKDPLTFWANRAAQQGKTLSTSAPPTPSVIPPIQNAYPKEKLVLPQPSYRVSNTLARFEDKSLGLVRYVDKSMANVGYQESDRFVRPEQTYIRASDAYLDEEMDHGSGDAIGGGGVGRVEYDMDDQDDFWLKAYNEHRKASSTEGITPEMFEITITKIEKEWHTLEKRIPKPNPKPPQTHRPRSSSAAAVNGEPQVGEEQDSKCVICDDGDCENTNAIVFCDGCDLAVHQECYGVPFIPEGQWLCRRCQLAGRGIPVSCSICVHLRIR